MMYQEDYFSPTDPNNYDYNPDDNALDKIKSSDKGYNAIYRRVQRSNGKWRNKKIEVYSSGYTGNRIRDAETGEYYSNLVGSADEELFFKVVLATGECTSENGSSTLFFASPQHYANHLQCVVNPELSIAWERRRDQRLEELRRNFKESISVEVR